MGRFSLVGLATAMVITACASSDPPAGSTSSPGRSQTLLIEKPSRADIPWEETPEFAASNEKCPSDLILDPISEVSNPEVALTLVAPLEEPSALAFSPDGTAFIGTRTGGVYFWDRDTAPVIVLDLTGETTTEREQGLLGLTVHDGKLFVNRTDLEDDTVIEAYPLVSGRPDGDGRVELLRADQPSKEHNGGDLAFGPDDHLYLTLGDGGGQGGAFVTGRLEASEFGSLLRLRYEPGDNARLVGAPDNPFAGDEPGSDLVWIWGLRHPYRFAFDSMTDDLWIADIGQQCMEEVTMLPGGGAGGEHLGWNAFEGRRPFMPELPLEMTEPTFAYLHTDGWCAVIGGHVYRGEAIEQLRGQYIFGDFCRRAIVAFDPATGELRELERGTVTPIGFAVHPDGELYVIDLAAGIWRIETP